MEIDYWDARSGGSWRYVDNTDDHELGFHGCFHEISENRIVQTFTFEGMPDGVALETLTFEQLQRRNMRSQDIAGVHTARYGLQVVGEENHQRREYCTSDQTKL